MLKYLIVAAFAAIPAAGHAATIADFELNGTLANAIGNGVTLTNNGGTLGAQGITFGANQGPTVSGLGSLTAYTIDVGFTINNTNGYVKLIDFSSLNSDAGYYNLNGNLSVFPLSSSANTVFTAGTPVRLTLSRDNTGLITAYIDGTQIYSQLDPANGSNTLITALNPLRFFTDDFATGQREASSGFVDYIRIADTAVTPGQIAPPVTPGVPEPATWAMMLLGFGSVGYTMRRKSKAGTRIRFA